MPEAGFLFPAFNDRGTDLHSTLFYTKDADELKESFVENLLGCPLPLPAGSQKESFHALIEETLAETCSIDAVINIHERLNEIIAEHKEDPVPLIMDKEEVKTVFADSGVSNEKLETFDRCFDATAGEGAELVVNNVINARTFEVKTPDIVIKVNPERIDLVRTQMVNGRECLVIDLGSNVTVNGIAIHRGQDTESEE